MSIVFEDHELAPIYPIAPRMREDAKKPFIGPSRKDYQEAHAKTVGEGSDEWWEKVSNYSCFLAFAHSLLRGFLGCFVGRVFTGVNGRDRCAWLRERLCVMSARSVCI